VLRKAAAAHGVIAGPAASSRNAFTLGTPATQINEMQGDPPAAASFACRPAKKKKAGEKPNALPGLYREHLSPLYCARQGLVDEIISLPDLREYIAAFAGCAYQNPKSICPHNHMILPRIIKD
jgi:glutaconyl-CoA decarboxylase